MAPSTLHQLSSKVFSTLVPAMTTSMLSTLPPVNCSGTLPQAVLSPLRPPWPVVSSTSAPVITTSTPLMPPKAPGNGFFPQVARLPLHPPSSKEPFTSAHRMTISTLSTPAPASSTGRPQPTAPSLNHHQMLPAPPMVPSSGATQPVRQSPLHQRYSVALSTLVPPTTTSTPSKPPTALSS